MIPVDMESWDRKEIFDFFSHDSNPFYMMTFRVDVTNLYNYVKKENLSFYHSMVFLVTKAVNSIKNFHYSIEDGKVVIVKDRVPSFTDIKKGSELFHIITIPAGNDIKGFCKTASEKNENQKEFINFKAESGDLIYISCLPWLDLTAATNEFNWGNPTTKDENIPRIIWGKYTESEGRKTLCISVECNHRFIDGIHLGMFSKELERLINELE